jgi:hypothetical protein
MEYSSSFVHAQNADYINTLYGNTGSVDASILCL